MTWRRNLNGKEPVAASKGATGDYGNVNTAAAPDRDRASAAI
jgi:hypothetical protein